MIDADPIFVEPEGATPLGPDEMDGLIPTWVATRNDLNTVEHDNITEAMVWAIRKKWTVDLLLSSDSICDLHRRMFCDVWKWAGTLRQRVTTIGVPPAQISVQLHNLLADVRAQVDSVDVYPWSVDEIAVRFHHRLVLIHPFPNGNGRHSRLAADLLAVSLGERRFTWGGARILLLRARRGRSTWVLCAALTSLSNTAHYSSSRDPNGRYWYLSASMGLRRAARRAG